MFFAWRYVYKIYLLVLPQKITPKLVWNKVEGLGDEGGYEVLSWGALVQWNGNLK